MDLDFTSLGLPTAEGILPGVESFMNMRLIAGLLFFVVGITLTPWMVKSISKTLDVRVLNVRGMRPNQTRWTDEEYEPHRLWYIGRTVAGWVGSALGNPFYIWPKGWGRDKRDGHLEDLKLLRDQNLNPLSRGDLEKRLKGNMPAWDQARRESIGRYRGWLKGEIAKGLNGGKSQAYAELQELHYELKSGERLALGCWCRPDACHGDVVVDGLAYLELNEMDEDELARRFGKKKYRTIIAGSRGIDELALVEEAVEHAGWKIGEVISGDAQGVDKLGIEWGKKNKVGVSVVPAKWEQDGKRAGFIRNEKMAEQADALIAVWDGKSSGTRHMIETARARGLAVYVYRTDEEGEAQNRQAVAAEIEAEDASAIELQEDWERLGKDRRTLELERETEKRHVKRHYGKEVRIEAPHFVAGLTIGGSAAPIVKYMAGWSPEKIEDYCAKKGWTATFSE